MKYIIPVILLIIALLPGCRYDKDFGIISATCDTASVTYSGSVKPILTTYCITCHSGPNAPLGINLDAHTPVKIVADNKKLMGAINHASGFSPMPKNSPKLNDCDIAKIRIWIAGGALNN